MDVWRSGLVPIRRLAQADWTGLSSRDHWTQDQSVGSTLDTTLGCVDLRLLCLLITHLVTCPP
jgi:hypothetical protein